MEQGGEIWEILKNSHAALFHMMKINEDGIYIYIYIQYLTKVSTPLTFQQEKLVYLLKGQYYTNETWIYFRVVNVQLV